MMINTYYPPVTNKLWTSDGLNVLPEYRSVAVLEAMLNAYYAPTVVRLEQPDGNYANTGTMFYLGKTTLYWCNNSYLYEQTMSELIRNLNQSMASRISEVKD